MVSLRDLPRRALRKSWRLARSWLSRGKALARRALARTRRPARWTRHLTQALAGWSYRLGAPVAGPTMRKLAVRLQPWLGRAGRALLWALTCPTRRGPARRSLWAGTPILTLPIKARGEEHLGVRADTLVYVTYFITDAFTYNLQALANRGPRWWRKLLPYLVLLWACLRYQRFHFFLDQALLPMVGRRRLDERELRLYQYLGKEVFFYAYGADIRTRERTLALGEPNCCTECPDPLSNCICEDYSQRSNYEMLSRYATGIFSMGDMLHYTPGSRNDLFYWPIDLERDGGRRYAPRYPDPDSTAPVRVVHAPNHRSFKGTHFLLEAVQKLQAEGVPLELRLVERVPNRQALEIYRTADIVFDQCLIGFHGYFALEALAMGKPVLVFIRDRQRYLLHPEECPFVSCPADRVAEVLRDLATDRQRLFELGVQGRRYIEKHFTTAAFAQRLRRAYADLGLPGFRHYRDSRPMRVESPAARQPRRAA
jgi:glycosyltransferase involved in cell wall biosynthesis